VTFLSRLLALRSAAPCPAPASRRRAPLALLRRPALALASLAACATALLAMSAPASALVETVGGQAYGLTPRSIINPLSSEGEPLTFANATGHPVVHSGATFAVYWDPTDHYHGDWQGLIDAFFRNMSLASGSLPSVLAVDAQYTDSSNQHAAFKSAFRGAYTDTDPYPVAGCTDPHPLLPADAITCITDQQVREELSTFVSQHALPRGMGSIFYLLTPPGVTVCLDAAGVHCSDSPQPPAIDANSFCSYHSAISPTSPVSGDGNTLLYGVIPWSAGGVADYHLAPTDRPQAYDCQDGGYDPSSRPSEKREKAKEMNAKEEEEFLRESEEEKQKTLKTRELEGPHIEEPNQIGLGPDGSYDTGLADLIINQIATQQQNIVTDPLLDAWQDGTRHEVADECRNWFAPSLGGSVTANELTEAGSLYNQTLGGSNYYLNTAFNLAALKLPYPAVPCVPGVNLVPAFTVPNAVNSGDIVGFDGMESDITLDAGTGYTPAGAPKPAYANFTWEFGDGSPAVSGFAPGAPAANSPAVSPCQAPWEAPCAASAFHSYKYGGTYQVTLTVTDVGGYTASVIHPIVVDGPPPPTPPPGPGAPGGTPNGPSSGAGPGSGSTGLGLGIPAPIARAAAIGRSLQQALSRGLLVSYTVNEQVAGHFEVLLDATAARRLGIKGAKAFGLPAGSPSSLIVGQALLVTTKGGHSTVRIRFSRNAAQRLRHVRKLTLLLRLVVRNAAIAHPQSTTVLVPIVLHR
jgi:hypothetical protein